MVKQLQVTISGTYYNSKKEKVDFDKIVGHIPLVSEEHAAMHVRGRYAVRWIKEAKDKKGELLYPERIDRLHQCFIDNIREVEGKEFSFVGKDIKEMSQDELQDLATAKDIRAVPLPASGFSKRNMLELAYAGYCKSVLKRPLKPAPHEAGFNFSKLPALVVDGSVRVDNTKKLSNDEVIEGAQRPQKGELNTKPTPETAFSREELCQLADEAEIEYDENTSHADLYKAVFGGKAA